MSGGSWLAGLARKAAALAGMDSDKKKGAESAVSDRGILVFENTSAVIAAERLLRQAGFDVEVKGPPPDMQTGCDMVVAFPAIKLAAVENVLKKGGIQPQKVLAAEDSLLEPVSLFHVKDMGQWLMARAANMKITMDKNSGVIVNISGGGCPDVPWLARKLCGKKLCEAPEPISLGHTLCCYSLQKAYEELKRIWPCG